MSIFDSIPSPNSSKGNNFPCESVASVTLQSYVGDPAAIARDIFRAEMQDVLKVLHNCGTLHTYDEKLWCLLELAQLLDELCPDEVV